MTIQRISLAAVMFAGTIGFASIAQAADWVELGKASTGETIKLYLDSVKTTSNVDMLQFTYQIGADDIEASVDCATRKVYPYGYNAYIPNKDSTTDQMVDRVCEIGRRLNKKRKKPPVLPLQVGTYSVGSKYIQIAKQGDRLCFQGSSNHGMTIANLIPSRNGLYAINTWDDSFVKQQDADHLLFGSAENMLPYPMNQEVSGGLSEPMQECLNSTEPFFQQYKGMRNPVRVK